MTKKEPWWKSNIFSLISLALVVAGGISAGAVMRFQLQQAIKDIEVLQKDIKEMQALGNVKSITKHIDDQVFKMKTSLYKEIEKIEILFKEKFRNSERREQEFRQDIKELQKSIYRIKRGKR